MNKNNRKKIKSVEKYAMTFLTTLFLVILFSIGYMITIYIIKNPEFTHYHDSENELLEYLIDKYKFLEKQSPTNYIINLKLGILYEAKNNLKEAEKEYKKSIDKRPFRKYSPDFRLANMYINQKRINDALYIVENIGDFYSIDMFYLKANFYFHLGDDYFAKGDYYAALNFYQTATFYYKKIPEYNFKVINKRLIECYTNIAKKEIEKGNIETAMAMFKKAEVTNFQPVLSYKLALLYYSVEPLKSLEYFEKTFKADPTIINYQLYVELLKNLETDAKQKKDKLSADLYFTKLKNLERFINYTRVLTEDLEIKIYKKKLKKALFNNDKILQLEFSVINKTNIPIRHLYVTAEIIDESDILGSETFFVKGHKKIMKFNDETEKIKLKKRIEYIDAEISKRVNIDIYVRKKKNVKKTYITTITMD